ncbi:MAG: hypothetical protein M3505_00920 [Verrucomicrobiota bacterium]|nr:hypothetical protein [Verrucomicrobiota bacterium]
MIVVDHAHVIEDDEKDVGRLFRAAPDFAKDLYIVGPWRAWFGVDNPGT